MCGNLMISKKAGMCMAFICIANLIEGSASCSKNCHVLCILNLRRRLEPNGLSCYSDSMGPASSYSGAWSFDQVFYRRLLCAGDRNETTKTVSIVAHVC